MRMPRRNIRLVLVVVGMLAAIAPIAWWGWDYYVIGNRPIRFYARVVDEQGTGLAGVSVAIRLTRETLLTGSNRTGRTAVRADGAATETGGQSVTEDPMAKPLVPDELWEVVEPLLPPHPPRPKGGRPPVPDRACLAGILFVLRTGIGWEDLPAEMGCGSGMTCWRRLRDWHKAGVFQRLHEALLGRLRAAGCVDWEHVVVDSSHVRAVFGGRRPARARSTGGRRGRSTTSPRTPAASRSPRRSRRPTATT